MLGADILSTAAEIGAVASLVAAKHAVVAVQGVAAVLAETAQTFVAVQIEEGLRFDAHFELEAKEMVVVALAHAIAALELLGDVAHVQVGDALFPHGRLDHFLAVADGERCAPPAKL